MSALLPETPILLQPLFAEGFASMFAPMHHEADEPKQYLDARS